MMPFRCDALRVCDLSTNAPKNQSFWDDPILDQRIVEIASGSFKRRSPPESLKIGDVMEALATALRAFWISEDFRSGAARVVEIGDDAGGRCINLWTDCGSVLRDRRDSGRVARNYASFTCLYSRAACTRTRFVLNLPRSDVR